MKVSEETLCLIWIYTYETKNRCAEAEIKSRSSPGNVILLGVLENLSAVWTASGGGIEGVSQPSRQ